MSVPKRLYKYCVLGCTNEHRSRHNLLPSEPRTLWLNFTFEGKSRKKSVTSLNCLGINTNALCAILSSRQRKCWLIAKVIIVSACFHWCCLQVLSEWSWIGMWYLKVAYESNVSRSFEVVEQIIRSGTYKVCDSMRPAMLLFLSHSAPRLCNS